MIFALYKFLRDIEKFSAKVLTQEPWNINANLDTHHVEHIIYQVSVNLSIKFSFL